MLRTLVLFSSIIAFYNLHASDFKYAVSNIPGNLLKNANVVKRNEIIRFEITSPTSTTLQYQYAFTILNENGDKFSSLIEFYDKARKITSISGTLYDASGKEIKKLKSKDVIDASAVDDISLIDDNRKKVHSFYHKTYPYTVEYEVEIKQNNTFHFPTWITQEDEHLSLESSRFSVIYPENYKLRFKSFNYPEKPVEEVVKNTRTLTWHIKNVPAKVKEIYSPRWHELTTMVSIAPSEFQIEGYKGDMTSWKEFGKFFYKLNNGRHLLPEETKQQVRKLTGNIQTDSEKIVILYNFLQKNTRYISIQLGLGGWQPFEASFVAKKGYGDCKALSNYMYSLLKEAGINSYYTLIKAGPNDNLVMPDFPSNQFNHAILCVPIKNDTIWLECTSQTTAAGYMGQFTGNRKALVLTEDGGVLVDTKSYLLSENLQTRKVTGFIDEEGMLDAKIETRFFNIQQDNLHQMINSLSIEKVKEFLQEELELPTYNINQFKYTEKKHIYPEIHEELELFVANFATVTGKRLFIIPNLLNRSNTKFNSESRLHDVCFTIEFRDVDTVEYELPKGYKAEFVPQDVSITTKYGNYFSSIKLYGNKLTYIRVREQYSGRYSAKEYAEIVKFYNEIYKSDRTKIVMVKQDH